MIRSTDIVIKGPVGDLDVLHVQNDQVANPKGILVFNHPNPTEGGTNRNKVVTTVSKAFAKKDFVVYLPNLRGTGKSEGEFSQGPGEKEDMMAVIEQARLMHPGVDRLVIGGFSFGGFVATLAEEEARADDVILVAPAVNRYAIKSPTIKNAKTFMIYGNEDEVISEEDIYNWCGPQDIPVHVVVGASHFFHRKLIVLENLIKECFPFNKEL